MNATDRPALTQYRESSVSGDTLRWEGHMADDVAATDGPEPMALLIATSDSLFLSSTRGNFKLPRHAIAKLGRGKFYPWCFSALRIHHSVPNCPRSLQFKPLRTTSAEVRAQLKGLGYPG